MRLILVIVFLIRVALSLIAYNGDLNNHFAWMDSANAIGFRGIYERDVSPWAPVNYPPVTLYAFWVGEKVYEQLPPVLKTVPIRAAFYKLPGLIADCLIAWLIWRYTGFSRKMKLVMMGVFLLNPALAYNSVFWGQVESFVTFFTIASLLAFTRREPGWGIILFALAVLGKQNALPLIPVILFALFLTRGQIKHILGGILVSISLVYFAYAPFAPIGQNVFRYAVTQYAGSVGGQAHQHESSVNALNAWYALGYNHIADSTHLIGLVTIRNVSTALTAIGVILAGVYAVRNKKNPYAALFLASAFISLWTFVFTSRMHERHSYMLIAYLVFLIPYLKKYLPYILLSGLCFFNLYGVWAEYFNYNRDLLAWIIMTRLLSLGVVWIALMFPRWMGETLRGEK